MSFARSLAILTVLTIAAVDSAWSQSHGQNQTGLTVVNPWSRATAPSQKAGGVFLTIENASDQPDRLIGVESEMSEEASLHTMIRDGDVMRMRPVEGGIEVPANGNAVLAPGGNHVMLIGLREHLVKDTTVPITLIFERAGRVEIEATVQSAGARGPAGHGQHGAMPRSGN